MVCCSVAHSCQTLCDPRYCFCKYSLFLNSELFLSFTYTFTVVLEKTLEGRLDFKEIKSVNPKGNQSFIRIGRTDNIAELGPDVNNWLIRKDRDAGKNWRQGEKGTTEDERVRWHHQLDRHEFEQVLGVSNGQGSLACYSLWGSKQSDMTEWLNWPFHSDSVLPPPSIFPEHLFFLRS